MEDPERAIAIAYAPAARRRAFATLLALDDRLADLALRRGDAGLAAIRMAWWREALAMLDDPAAPPPADPLLLACRDAGLPCRTLAAMTDGWDAVIDDPAIGAATMAEHAEARGARLFAIAGAFFGGDDARLADAGRGWALADLARRRPEHAAALLAAARVPLDRAFGRRWPRAVRPVAQLALLARRDAVRGVPEAVATRARVARLLAFQITGR